MIRSNLAACALTLAALMMTLGGCATVRGSQAQSRGFSAPGGIVGERDALSRFSDPTDAARGGRNQRAYRNEVIDQYLTDIDALYDRYVADLGTSMRASALGFDVALLGLGAATALAGAGAVDELTTVTATTIGLRGAIDKRLFFDQTLPTLIAGMDAERASIEAEIERRKKLPIEEYSMRDAFRDVRKYNRAGRLDRGLSRLAALANTDRAAEMARVSAIAEGCDVADAETAKLDEEFRKLIRGDQAKEQARMADAAAALTLTDDGQAMTFDRVAGAFDKTLCGDNDGKREFLDKLRAKITAREGGS